MVLTAIAVILISCSSIQANSAAFETDPFHQPDFRIGVGVGTDGPFIFVGIDRAYQYSNFSLEPLGTVIGKTFELGQDFFQNPWRYMSIRKMAGLMRQYTHQIFLLIDSWAPETIG